MTDNHREKQLGTPAHLVAARYLRWLGHECGIEFADEGFYDALEEIIKTERQEGEAERQRNAVLEAENRDLRLYLDTIYDKHRDLFFAIVQYGRWRERQEKARDHEEEAHND